MDLARTPVIVGVGQVADRAPPHADGPTPLDLAAEATRRALADAGIAAASIDWLGAVGQISFRDMPDFDRQLCERLGTAPRAVRLTAPTGDSPVRLLNEAANAIGDGEAQVALIAGAEALRTAARRSTDAVFGKAPEGDSTLRQRYGLRTPAAIYPFYEQATRAAWGQSAAQAREESAALWEGMARIAATEPEAWIHDAPDRHRIADVTPDNRLIAYPYTKLMVANAGVNQGAAVLVASLAAARDLGVPAHRIVHIGAGAAAHENEDPLQRERYDRSCAMEKTLAAVLERNALVPGDVDHLELYSCFPIVPKMARRILDWSLDKPITAFGGLTFGGGPIANYMTHAIASMVARIRREPGCGLVFGNGGYASHYHAMVLSSTPPAQLCFPQEPGVHEPAFHEDVDAQRGAAPAIDDVREGPAVIETYTVLYARDGRPDYGAVIARRADGSRLLARVDGDDAPLVALLTDGRREPVGTPGTAVRGEDGLLRWRADPSG